jgi:hypothetical protein
LGFDVSIFFTFTLIRCCDGHFGQCPDVVCGLFLVSCPSALLTHRDTDNVTRGLLLQAATSALLIYVRGHTKAILKFQDRPRLVLVVFLLAAAQWAQVDFINLIIPTNPTFICQITVTISTLFDQLARVAIGAFLLWAIGDGTRSMAERYGLGVLVGLRTIFGGIFVGFTRTQFEPVCVARSTLLPVSITVLGLDALILIILVIQLIQIRNPRSGVSNEKTRALTLVVLGFFIWTVVSIFCQRLGS